jgi:hypothetical protein
MRPDLTHFRRPPRPPAVGDIARQLRELPAEAFPPYDFEEFQRRSRERLAPRQRLVTWPHAAAAAGLTAFVAAMALLGTSGGPSADGESGPAPSGPATVVVAPGNTTPADDPVEQASAGREWLARHPEEPALVRAGARLAAASLEDRIAWFDDALTDQRLQGANPTQLKVLQQERARLVSSLAQVRFADALVADGS